MSEIPTRDWSSIDAAAMRFERAWKDGSRPRIEDYLIEAAEPQRAPLLDELLRVEIELRRRGGEQPTVEEYRERFPAHASVVVAVFSDGPESNVRDTENLDRSRIRGALAGLGQTSDAAPRVLLRDTEPEPDSAVVRPTSPEMPKETGRYQLLGEIGHGGMGAVLKGRDPDLGRDLAVKILLEEHQDDADLVRRFIEEAQIGGQLQHPGIVPVYELGKFADGRPYFTMKLIKGRTLAALLKDRAGPAHELPRYLGIFEQLCQAMAYAHARGVIHRDLKPSNIMVGSFGEVQVMDWGLAKVLPQGGVADEPRPDTDVQAASVIRTVRSGSDADASVPGSVLGTPAYMAPEQAGGDVELIDERADVFGLGSILCEILTGRPAYTGQSFDAILRKARRGETKDALQRLDGCGADAELVALAGHCLAAEADERRRDAGELARRMTAYLSGVQDRLRAAELARATEEARAEEAIATAAASERARAAEEARAEEAQKATVAAEGRARAERRARRTTAGLAASVLIAGALGASGWRWIERDRLARMAAISTRVNTALQEATGLRGQAQGAAVGDLVSWTKALAAAQKARELLEPGLDLALRGRVEALLGAISSEKGGAEAAARTAESDRRMLDRLVDIRSAKTDDFYGSISDVDYAKAFREAGIDVTGLPPTEAGAMIKARPAPMAAVMVSALDDWAAARRSRRWDGPGAMRLSEAANAADPDPWRVSLRRALDLGDRPARAKALRDLAASTKPEAAPAVDLDLLGTALSEAGDPKAAEEVLRAGRRRFPDDVWLNYDLARALEELSRGEEAVRYYSVARALRPETAHELAHALEAKGESVEAIEVFQDLVRLRPDDGRHWHCYGSLLKERGDRSGAKKALEQAVAILRRRIQLNPDDAEAHHVLGDCLRCQGKPAEAIAELREAVRLGPNDAKAHDQLGTALRDHGELAQAIAEFREAVRIKPDYTDALNNLGIALLTEGKPDDAIAAFREAIQLKPDSADLRNNLGNALKDGGKLEEAIAEYKTAIRMNPQFANPHNGLGNVLHDQGKLEEAIAEYKTAIHLNPEYVSPPCGLGSVLYDQGKLEDAIAAFREAIRIKPDYDLPHANLGNALQVQKKIGDAIVEYRLAIRLKPGFAGSHYGLANALLAQNKLEESIAEYDEAIRLKPDYAEAHSNLGNALGQRSKLAEALAEYHEATRLAPDLVPPRINFANILRHKKRLEESIIELQTAIRIKPDDANSHFTLGLALFYQGQTAAAIAEYSEAIRLKPDHATARNNWAWGLVVSPRRPRRDCDEALVHARKAVELAPWHGGSFNTLALAEYRSAHWAESLAASERSMKLRRGGSADDWFFQALARWRSGDKDEARKWFDKAVAWTKAKEPNNAELRQFWSEAAELLGQPGPDASGVGSSNPAVKPR
jgi:eukaryotic-like serine/threonine-protein kinase